MSKTATIPEYIKSKIKERYEHSFGYELKQDAAEFGYSLSQSKIQELEKENERLRNLIKVRERSSHHAFYSHATTMTEFQIEKQFNERWQQFKEQNNL